MRRSVKVYRMIQEKNRFFGLELTDLIILMLVYLFLFLLSKNLILNLSLTGAAYFFLRFYKKGKPPHWTVSVIRFLISKKRYSLAREMKGEIINDPKQADPDKGFDSKRKTIPV